MVTTARDPEGRPTVTERLGPDLPRLMPVGRLDINSEGLLLLTNDGALKRMLELPATGWLRRYRVRVYGTVDPEALKALEEGIEIDGVRYGSIKAEEETRTGANAWLKVGLREGKNREVRRVLLHLGLEVSRLIRTAYGPFQLGALKRGGIEEVTPKVLKEQLGGMAARLTLPASRSHSAGKAAPQEPALPSQPSRRGVRRPARGGGEPAPDHRRAASRPAPRGAGGHGRAAQRRAAARGGLLDARAPAAGHCRRVLSRSLRRQRCDRPRGPVARCCKAHCSRGRPGSGGSSHGAISPSSARATAPAC